MDPSFKLAIGEFKDHKGVYLAIVLIVALSMTVFTTQSAMNQYNDYVAMRSIGTFYGGGIVAYGGTTIRNIISGAAPMSDARQIVEKINAIPGFKATPRAEVEGAMWTKISSDGLTVWGVDLKTDEDVCHVKDKIIDGSYFDTSKNYTQSGMGNPFGAQYMYAPTMAGESGLPAQGGREYTRSTELIYPYPILIGKTCAEINEFKVGTIFWASMLTPAAAIYCDVYYEVIGIYETDKPMIDTLFYVIPIESVQEIKGWNSETANYICVSVPEGMSDQKAREALAPVIGDKVFYSMTDLKNAIEGNLNAIGQTILETTIAASLILAAAAVKFVMDSIIIRKSREIGTLKALGARDRTVARIFLYQALFIGILAGALGLGIAAVLMNVISAYGITLNYSLGAQMRIKFILTPAIVITALALPVIVSVLASILPCEKVARLSPVEAIRRGDLQGAKEGGKSVFSILGKFWPRFKKSLSPLSLAIDEMKDHAAIYAVVIIVIGIALSVFTLQASYQHNLEEIVTRTMKNTICADGMILGEGSTPRQMMGGAPRIENARALVDQIHETTGYTTVVRSNRQAVVVLGTDANPIYEGGSIWGIDTKNDESVFHLKSTIIRGDYFDPSKDYSQNVVGEQGQFIPGLRWSGLSSTVINEKLQEPYPIIMGEAAAKSHGLDIDSQFSILLTDSTKGSGLVSAPFKIIGIYETSFAFTDSLIYFAPIEAINQMMGYNAEDGNAVAVMAPEGTDYKQIYSALSSAAPGMEAFSWHEAVSYMIGPAFDAMLLIIYTAIGITLILAAVIINYAMDSTVSRKTREIGTLKAFGARDRTIVKMFLYQGAVVGILSGILAVVFSAALAYIIINVIHLNTKMPMGLIMEVGFSVTGAIIAITLLAPIMTSLLAAALPSKRAAALSPVEAIRKGELNM